MKRIGVVAASIALLGNPVTTNEAHAQNLKETFPRVAHIPIRYSKDLADPAYRQKLARHDILVLGMWRGYTTTDRVTGERLGVRDVVVDIKARARAMGNADLLVGKYTTFNEVNSDPNNSASRFKWDKLHAETGPGYPVNNDWWARDKDGNNTSSWPGAWLTNVTDFVKRDASGYTYPEWAVTSDYEFYFAQIPEFDMWYFDNWFYRPRVNADWDGDGVNDDKNDPAVRRYFREGYARGLRRARELAPNLIMIGNVDGDPGGNRGMLTEPEYTGQLTALYEAAIGLDHSTETWGGWNQMMKQYQTTILNAQHNLAIVNVHGPEDDYALMRYGLASVLMDNGYYYYTSSPRSYQSEIWFDEYEVDLGRAIDPPQYSDWQNGVYRRRFENGLVLVNPKGNGRRTVNVGSGYRRIQGSQDPQTNNGQVAETITLDERDGIVLVRIDAPNNKRPKPPVLSGGP